MHELKKILKKDIKEFEDGKKSLNGSTLQTLHLLTDTYKNLCKIEMLEEGEGYSEEMGGSSYARGRRNAPRDRMGRYTSYGMGGSYGEDGYSEDGRSRGISYGDGKDHMKRTLGELMEGADPESREILKKCMQDLDRI